MPGRLGRATKLDQEIMALLDRRSGRSASFYTALRT